MTTKLCSKCRRVLPLSEFWRDKSVKSGLRSWCKTCIRDDTRNRYRADLGIRQRTKKRLREWYAVSENAERAKKRNREWMREWRRTHLDETRERNRRWKIENRDKRRAEQRRTNHRYRAKKRGAFTVGPVDPVVVYARDGGFCHICLKHVAKKDATLDHLVPLSQNGSHTMENVALAHRVCNSRRGAGRLPTQLRLVG